MCGPTIYYVIELLPTNYQKYTSKVIIIYMQIHSDKNSEIYFAWPNVEWNLITLGIVWIVELSQLFENNFGNNRYLQE